MEDNAELLSGLRSLDDLTRPQLQAICKQLGIKSGRRKKCELIASIRQALGASDSFHHTSSDHHVSGTNGNDGESDDGADDVLGSNFAHLASPTPKRNRTRQTPATQRTTAENGVEDTVSGMTSRSQAPFARTQTTVRTGVTETTRTMASTPHPSARSLDFNAATASPEWISVHPLETAEPVADHDHLLQAAVAVPSSSPAPSSPTPTPTHSTDRPRHEIQPPLTALDAAETAQLQAEFMVRRHAYPLTEYHVTPSDRSVSPEMYTGRGAYDPQDDAEAWLVQNGFEHCVRLLGHEELLTFTALKLVTFEILRRIGLSTGSSLRLLRCLQGLLMSLFFNTRTLADTFTRRIDFTNLRLIDSLVDYRVNELMDDTDGACPPLNPSSAYPMASALQPPQRPRITSGLVAQQKLFWDPILGLQPMKATATANAEPTLPPPTTVLPSPRRSDTPSLLSPQVAGADAMFNYDSAADVDSESVPDFMVSAAGTKRRHLEDELADALNPPDLTGSVKRARFNYPPVRTPGAATAPVVLTRPGRLIPDPEQRMLTTATPSASKAVPATPSFRSLQLRSQTDRSVSRMTQLFNAKSPPSADRNGDYPGRGAPTPATAAPRRSVGPSNVNYAEPISAQLPHTRHRPGPYRTPTTKFRPLATRRSRAASKTSPVRLRLPTGDPADGEFGDDIDYPIGEHSTAGRVPPPVFALPERYGPPHPDLTPVPTIRVAPPVLPTGPPSLPGATSSTVETTGTNNGSATLPRLTPALRDWKTYLVPRPNPAEIRSTVAHSYNSPRSKRPHIVAAMMAEETASPRPSTFIGGHQPPW
ncbi:hypothetical protein IWQ60_002719 [Tieghemiomyces parasiticus]|uniref:SAP domain-containing protein n=1 Tax=Tieghemiomyces parasiticus TaxID=78921 RepID=A0A9W8ABQ0_9FUNG|nr:hypothetical protein IWQ60_002719 [Tieghemiomyces parasiticus]